MLKKRIGFLDTCIGSFDNTLFYNLQDLGLAKALSDYFEEVFIYRLLPLSQKASSERINCNTTIFFIPSKKIGGNGFPDLSHFDSDLDVLIFFSDTQLCFPKVYRWCKKNHILLIPYIGVTKSNSSNFVIRSIVNLLYLRNSYLYKKLPCLAKTPSVFYSLKSIGVKSVLLFPVCLDLDLIKTNFDRFNSSDLKSSLGFNDKDKIILFVGRLTYEKRPLEMLSFFKRIYSIDNRFRLLMVGTGELAGIVKKKIIELNFDNVVKLIDKVPNKDMWSLYKSSECFVNLNSHEIFGMSILEALFYDCKVVAWSAPGPDYIIENGVSGWIVNNENEFINKVIDPHKFKTNQYVRNNFLWNSSALDLVKYIESLFP